MCGGDGSPRTVGVEPVSPDGGSSGPLVLSGDREKRLGVACQNHSPL